MNERYDSLDKYYDNKILDKINIFLFWSSVILSFALLYLSNPTYKTWGNVLFILVTILLFACDNFLNLYLLRRAENKRRVHLLSNAFNVPMDNEETNKYYNNNQEPSILKLGANAFENSLFTSRVSKVMVINKGIIILISVTIWLALMLFRETSLELLGIIGLTLFSSNIFTNWLRVLILYIDTERIYEDFHHLFLQLANEDNVVFKARILNLVIRYECTKASMGANLSTKIFNKLNPEISLEWEKIKKKLSIK